MMSLSSAAVPILGLLAFLFVGFLLLSGGSRSGESLGYWFFALAVAWLIGAGVVLWPDAGHAGVDRAAAAAAPAHAASGIYGGPGHINYFTYR
jgi:hypothetical protein